MAPRGVVNIDAVEYPIFMNKEIVLGVCLILPSLALPAGANELEEIRVTADPLSHLDEHLIQPARVLGNEQLKTRSIRNIGETVSKEPGVTSSDFGAGAGRPVIRGLAGPRIKVLQDNIGTMDASTISPDHGVATEPVFAEQIEILRGPATLLYGSGASGGLVNVVTGHIPKYVPDGLEGEVRLQYETVNDGFTGAGAVTAGSGNLAVHLSGMKRDTGDYDIPGFAQSEPDADAEPGKLENSGVESENITGGLSYIGDRGSIGFSVNGRSSEYGIPEGFEEEGNGEEEEEEEGGVTIDMKQIRFNFLAALNNPMRGIAEVKTRWGYGDYEHDEIEPGGDIGSSFINDELEGRIEIVHEPIAGWNGVFGGQLIDREFSATGEEAFVLPSEQDSIALFLVEKADFADWHVDFGFRYENVDSKPTVGNPADHDLFSISGGATWHYLPGYQLGISLGHSQRAPSIEELYSGGPHLATISFDIGAPNLGKEKSNSIDLHWRKTEGRYTFAANLFYNRIEDFIFQQAQDLNNDGAADRVEEDFDGDTAGILAPGIDEGLLLLFHSQADTDFYGFELESVVTLIDDHRGDLTLRAWTDFVRGKLDSGGNLPRIPPWRLGGGLAYQTGPLDLNLDFTHVGKQTDTAELEDATAGYNMLSLYAGYDISYHTVTFTVFGRATNLLNEEARRHTSFVKDLAPLPGRSGIIGIRADF